MSNVTKNYRLDEDTVADITLAARLRHETQSQLVQRALELELARLVEISPPEWARIMQDAGALRREEQ